MKDKCGLQKNRQTLSEEFPTHECFIFRCDLQQLAFFADPGSSPLIKMSVIIRVKTKMNPICLGSLTFPYHCAILSPSLLSSHSVSPMDDVMKTAV